MNWLAVFIGGGLGSALRYLLSIGLNRYGILPWGTILANLLATLILGVVVFYFGEKLGRQSTGLFVLLTIGFCGGFSTFSTFSMEVFQLMRDGQFGYAIANVAISIIGAILILYFLWNRVQS
jgi:CrcB protein